MYNKQFIKLSPIELKIAVVNNSLLTTDLFTP